MLENAYIIFLQNLVSIQPRTRPFKIYRILQQQNLVDAPRAGGAALEAFVADTLADLDRKPVAWGDLAAPARPPAHRSNSIEAIQ